jgi:K+-sensing histidine kinase KdpD
MRDARTRTVESICTAKAERDRALTDMPTQRTCEYHRRRADPHGVGIAIETEGTLPLVRGDRVVVAVIASILLSNAIDRSPSGSRVRMRMERAAGAVVCEVRDAGGGQGGELVVPPGRARRVRPELVVFRGVRQYSCQIRRGGRKPLEYRARA